MTFDDLVRAGTSALRIGDYAGAEAQFRQAYELASSEADQALAEMHIASLEVFRQAPDPDLNVFRKNVVRRHTPRHLFTAAYYLVMSAVDRSDRDAADRYLPILLEAANATDDLGARLRAYDLAAGVESMRGNHSAAIEYGRAALDSLDGYQGDDLPGMLVGFTHNLAYNCLAANHLAEAVRHADAAIPLAEKLGNPNDIRQAIVTAAFAHLSRDELDPAEDLAARASDLAAGTRLEKYVHYIRGEIARRRGDREVAAAHFRKLEAFYPEVPTLTEMFLSMNFAPFLIPE